MPTAQPATPLASNLVRLRNARGLSQAEVADKSGISRQAYRALETGQSAPRGRTLMSLARALRVPVQDLLRPGRELRAVRFRADRKLATRSQVLADVARWLDDYNELEELLGAKRKPRLPAPSGGDPAALAARVRKTFRLKEDELIRDVCGLLEDKGVKVYRPRVASEHFFGLSVGARGGGPAVVVNTWERISVERWIFSAAHELAHLLMHLKAFDVEESDENAAEEKEADQFASHFLMPNGVFTREWDEARGLPLVERVFKLKQMFHVSYKTVLYRVQENSGDKAIWEKFFSGYKRGYGRVPGRTEEPHALDGHALDSPAPAAKLADEPEHLPNRLFVEDRLARLVREAVEKELITLSRAAEIMRVGTRDMRAIAASWTP
jgi:Zn-dependent peptidase ImmA (M78 family)/DNA-binding XRE family transcriptional regulator